MSWLPAISPAIGVPAAVAIALAAMSGCHHQPPAKVVQAESAAASSAAQAKVTGAVSAAQSGAAEKTVRLLITTQQVTHEVQAAAGASTPVPPELLARFDTAVVGVRRAADTADPNPAGDDSAGTGGPLPTR